MRGLLFLIVFLTALPAYACAILEKANPRVGSEVSGPVGTVTLNFSMQVFPKDSTISVSDEAGHDMASGPAFAGADDSVIVTKVKPLPPGKYKVHWNVLAACGSKEPGNYKFTVK
jgi:methionine-rich copper-binding protein CopC